MKASVLLIDAEKYASIGFSDGLKQRCVLMETDVNAGNK